MHEEYGDFWEIQGDARCITTNGILRQNGSAIMGAGIALQARERCKAQDYHLEAILGKMIKDHGNHTFYLGHDLFSFPTKEHWRDKSDLNLIERSAKELVDLAKNFPEYHRILLTQPGCGSGGLEWRNVKKVIENILDDRFIIVSQIYKFTVISKRGDMR